MTIHGRVGSTIDAIIDPFRLIGANRVLEKQLENLDTDPSFADIRALSEKNLGEYVQSEWTRSKELDDKLAKLTAVLSVALTVGGTVAKTFIDGFATSPLAAVAVILMLLSMACFLTGALIGFRGIQPKMRYGYGAAYLREIEKGGTDARAAMTRATSGFQVTNNIRSNQASAAVDLVRNGIVLFAVATALSFLIPRHENAAQLPADNASSSAISSSLGSALVPSASAVPSNSSAPMASIPLSSTPPASASTVQPSDSNEASEIVSTQISTP